MNKKLMFFSLLIIQTSLYTYGPELMLINTQPPAATPPPKAKAKLPKVSMPQSSQSKKIAAANQTSKIKTMIIHTHIYHHCCCCCMHRYR